MLDKELIRAWRRETWRFHQKPKKKKMLEEVWDGKGVGKAFKLNTVLGPMMPLAHGDGYILAGGWDASAGQESPGQTYIGTSEPSDSRCVFKVFVSTRKKNTALLTYLVKENNNCVELLRVVEPVRCDLQTSSQSSIDMQLFELQEHLYPDCWQSYCLAIYFRSLHRGLLWTITLLLYPFG